MSLALTIQRLKQELTVTPYESGWQWATHDYASGPEFRTREEAIADFNHWCTGGGLAEVLDGEVEHDPTAEAFALLDDLEGNLSRGQITHFRQQTRSEGGGIMIYIEKLTEAVSEISN